MTMAHIFNNGLKVIKSNAPEILTGLGVTGVVTTSYLVAKATIKTTDILDQAVIDEGVLHRGEFTLKEKATKVWKEYIPAAISGGLTIACILGASKSSARRTAAAVTAYSLTERAFVEYKEKVVEQIGKGKEQKVVDAVAQDRMEKHPDSDIIIIGSGEVTCCELFTNRYFKSSMESLRRAENELNSQINNELYASLDDFYDILGLKHTSNSDKIGWNSDHLVELKISAVLAASGEPCLAFDYHPYPKPLK